MIRCFARSTGRPTILSVLLVLLPPLSASAGDEPDPDAVINAFEAIGGVNPGLRRNHAKGTCATGIFVPTAQAAALSRSALFAGRPIPAVARFSLSGPKANAPDTAKTARGLAIQFQLPDGVVHQTAMLNTPVFGHATPQSFHDKLLAEAPDPTTGAPDPEKIQRFKATHPDNAAQSRYLAEHNPPPSYANTAYYSLNAFKVTNADGTERWIKWRFQPHDGVSALTDDAIKTLPANVLEERITHRARQGNLAWDMIVTIGQDGDPLDDPSVAWPEEREEITVGTLTLTRAGSDAEGTCEDINFDPNILSDGFDPSPDSILAFRSSAYAASFVRRSAEKAKAETK